MTEQTPLDVAIRLVLNMMGDKELATPGEIRSNSALVAEMLRQKGSGEVDVEQLVREVEMRCNVFVPTAVAMDDSSDHVEWLASKRSEVDWRFWERYRRYLEDVEAFAPSAVDRLDQVTDDILRRLENPLRQGRWDRRGLVVGQVQSGKTANYIGLVCKAADAGYRFIVVLTGIHNSLRAQTQLRLNAGFLGYDSERTFTAQEEFRTGVGRLLGFPLYKVDSLTGSGDGGDFNLKVARNVAVVPTAETPILLVLKKNGAVLRHVLRWTEAFGELDADGHRTLHDVPLLMIDDEADNASINTNPVLDDQGNVDPDYDPTRINKLIRSVLIRFDKRAYVGYTATPFANIYIADEVAHEDYGPDLFPHSFIISLRPPTNYVGPEKVFGLNADPDAGIEGSVGLPVVRTVDDYETWIPDKHNKVLIPGELPASLTQAILAFILACAAREARGESHAHNSMLIHVTRFNNVQDQVAEQVRDALLFIQRRLNRGDGGAPVQIMDELWALWQSDFLPTTSALQDDPMIVPLSWGDVEEHLNHAASRIEVRTINGRAKDALEYVNYQKEGLSVIAVGGDKLSRGLTLEGLTVSYYLRASKMYDTLLQMGRWFGYRPGYADVCRLYTTVELVNWYRYIATADEELRLLFEDMVARGATPREYGLRVRNHPSGLLITAPSKMRTGQRVQVTFSNTVSESIRFIDDPSINVANLRAAERLILQATNGGHQVTNRDVRHNHVWDGVPAEAVLDFLSDYTTHPKAPKVRADLLRRYVKARMEDDELIRWTVALISNAKERAHRARVDGFDVGLTVRHWEDGLAIGRLVSPSDEWLDFDATAIGQAIARTREAWEFDKGRSRRDTPPDQPTGPVVRRVRPAGRGLILLYPLKPPEGWPIPIVGFAISFPEAGSAEASAIEYTLNLKAWQQELDLDV